MDGAVVCEFYAADRTRRLCGYRGLEPDFLNFDFSVIFPQLRGAVLGSGGGVACTLSLEVCTCACFGRVDRFTLRRINTRTGVRISPRQGSSRCECDSKGGENTDYHRRGSTWVAQANLTT